MQGSVRKRGNTWSYRFDTGVVDGKRQQKEKGGFATKKEAEAALAKAVSDYNQAGQVFEPSEVTVADYLNYWFDTYCTNELKYNTQVGYLRIIQVHLIPAFGQYKLRALSPAALQEFAYRLKNQGLAKHTIDGILDTFGGALDYAVEPLHYIPFNPMSAVRHPKVERPPRQRIILQPDEWERVIGRFRGSRYELPLLIGFHTGLRISEAFALTWDDIDLDRQLLTVSRQVVKRNFGADVRKAVEKKGKKELRSSWYFQTPKSASSNRTVTLDGTICQALRKAKQQQREDELKYGEFYTIHVLKKEKDEKNQDMYRIVPVQKCVESQLPRARLICVAENGQYTSTDSFKYASRVIHNELKLPFDFHSLRHTHATMLIEANADIKDVQARLGHADISTTLNTYVHDTAQMQTRTAELFEQALARRTS